MIINEVDVIEEVRKQNVILHLFNRMIEKENKDECFELVEEMFICYERIRRLS